MKRALLISLAFTMLFSLPAFAKIHCEVDNLQDTISYKAIKKVMYINSVSTIDFIKTIHPDETNNYYVLVKFSNMRKKILENKAEIIIDGYSYPIKKATPNFYIEQPTSMTVGYFKVTPEAIAAIQLFKNDMEFKFYIRGSEPKTLSFGDKENKEIQLITTLNYADFEKVNNGEISVEK